MLLAVDLFAAHSSAACAADAVAAAAAAAAALADLRAVSATVQLSATRVSVVLSVALFVLFSLPFSKILLIPFSKLPLFFSELAPSSCTDVWTTK